MSDVQAPRQDLGLCGFSFTRNSEKCFTQLFRALFGVAMFRDTNMAAVSLIALGH